RAPQGVVGAQVGRQAAAPELGLETQAHQAPVGPRRLESLAFAAVERYLPCYTATSMRCRSGSHCDRPAEKGRRFCAEHAAELDRMREELKDAAAARIGRGRPKRSSTCCRPGCY